MIILNITSISSVISNKKIVQIHFDSVVQFISFKLSTTKPFEIFPKLNNYSLISKPCELIDFYAINIYKIVACTAMPT